MAQDAGEVKNHVNPAQAGSVGVSANIEGYTYGGPGLRRGVGRFKSLPN
jgi:hypothetical protein